MKRLLEFLKAHWRVLLLIAWCSWATWKLREIESNMLTASDLQHIEDGIDYLKTR